jgi:hypothetical protein
MATGAGRVPFPSEMTASRNERYLAAAIHGFSIPFPYVAAIIGFVVAKATGQPYARYHAAKALFSELAATAVTVTITVISLALSVPSFMKVLEGRWDEIDWWMVLTKAVVVWLAIAAFGLWNTVASIIQGLRALQGEDWGKPKLVDRWARRAAGVAHEVVRA